MERLTARDGSGQAHMVKYATGEVIERLAAYEDSGLSPVRCADMAAVVRVLDTLDDSAEYAKEERKVSGPFNSVLKKVEDKELRDELEGVLSSYICVVRDAAMWYGMRCMKDIFQPLEP